MAVGVQKAWSTTAASNGSADSNVNFVEGSGFKMPQINDSSRALMAAVKGFANQITGAKTTGGSANAYTFTSDSVAAISTAYAAGMGFVFVANHSNSGAATLNVDAVGATAIRKGGAQTALASGDIVANGVYAVYYNGTYWILINPETGQSATPSQPLDATLTALAALSTAASQYIRATGTDAFTMDSYATVLSNIGALASSSYTASDVLTKLLTVDGAGSGIDADLLDGQSSAYYQVAGAKLAALQASSGITGTFTVSTSDPSGGSDGDIWLKREA